MDQPLLACGVSYRRTARGRLTSLVVLIGGWVAGVVVVAVVVVIIPTVIPISVPITVIVIPTTTLLGLLCLDRHKGCWCITHTYWL